MRTATLLLATLLPLPALLAGCAAEPVLCSEDPDCRPVACGPGGCSGDGSSRPRPGGSGGGGGGGGAGGAGGAPEVPPVCTQMCDHVYVACGSVLTLDGAILSRDECIDACAEGRPSQAQAACTAAAFCGDWARCLEPVSEAACAIVCEKIYETCTGGLLLDGRLLDRAGCLEACPTGLTPGQASCIQASACADWLLCLE